MKWMCFDRLLTKTKSEEDLSQRIIAAEAQINELKARLNDSHGKNKHLDGENAVGTCTKVVGTRTAMTAYENGSVIAHLRSYNL